MFKKIILLLVVVLSAFCSVGCNKDEKVTVGILLTATHSALDNAKEGFIEALKANGYEDAEFVVKNPEGDFAGRLIEEIGYKGKSIGGAMVSEKHANFIVNSGNATGEDVKKLINEIKDKVKEKYNIELKVEQEFVE